MRFVKTVFRLSVLFIFLLLFSSHLYAADVTAPSKDNTYNLTVRNYGAVDMTGVTVSATLEKNPRGLITVKGVEPGSSFIKAGSQQVFKVKFDVDCPPEGTDEEGAGAFRFEIKNSGSDVMYIEGCGVNPGSCAELKGDFTVEPKNCKRHFEASKL